jgi:hypothetical protein
MRAQMILMILTVPVIFVGCDDDARNFANETKAVLDQRSAALSAKISAEKETYDKEAATASEDHRVLVDVTLQNDRNERSDFLAADYDEGRKPVSLWRKDLAEYAQIDYSTNRQLLISEADSNALYLQKIQDLTIDKDRVDALSKLLATLSKKPSLKDDVGSLASFVEDTKQNFDQKVCTQLKSQKGGSDAEAKAAAKSYDAKKCDDILKPK